MINNFHFQNPYWLLAILPIFFFYLKFFKGMKNKSSWEKICDPHLLKFLLIKKTANSRKISGYIILTAFISSIFILSSPVWSKKEIPNVEPENPLIILLNNSSDMLETDVSPDRLSRAKYKIMDLLNGFNGVQVGLVVYSDEPFLITPFTNDINLIKNLLPRIEVDIMPRNGDRLDRAISFAVKKLQGAKYNNGNIIILTSDIGERLDLAIASAKEAEKQNFDISLININSKNNEKLRYITKNHFNLSADESDVKSIQNKINNRFAQTLNASKNHSLKWIEYSYYFLFIPFLCCLYFFRRGVLIIIFILAFTQNSYAGFFTNANQEGLKAYKEKNYKKALETFEDPAWQASAYYNEKNYEQSFELFSKSKDITALYNQANSLAKLGRIEEAIVKYEEVLKKDENHEDAKFNLEYIKQQQNKDQQSSTDANDDDDDKNDEEEKETETSSKKQDDKEEQQKEEKEEQKDHEKQETETKTEDGEEKEKEQEIWSEEQQKEEQEYRDIPENTGGLLRAFIKKEHNKNRYKGEL